MNAETPQITSSNCASTSSYGYAGGDDVRSFQQWQMDPLAGQGRILQSFEWPPPAVSPQPIERKAETMADKTNRRIVQVFIADPNENVPLEKSVLYTGEQKLTELNDTELFFEVPIQDLLKAHNANRINCVDKEASKRAGKDILLDPVKIRDLRMVVVTVAQF